VTKVGENVVPRIQIGCLSVVRTLRGKKWDKVENSSVAQMNLGLATSAHHLLAILPPLISFYIAD
jgi:hypothetical protein